MATKKKRIVIALDEKYIIRLNQICVRIGCKQYSKVIKFLLDITTLNN